MDENQPIKELWALAFNLWRAFDCFPTSANLSDHVQILLVNIGAGMGEAHRAHDLGRIHTFPVAACKSRNDAQFSVLRVVPQERVAQTDICVIPSHDLSFQDKFLRLSQHSVDHDMLRADDGEPSIFPQNRPKLGADHIIDRPEVSKRQISAICHMCEHILVRQEDSKLQQGRCQHIDTFARKQSYEKDTKKTEK